MNAHESSTGRFLAAFVTLLLGVCVTLLGVSLPASAVPPGGPSPDTEGTAGTASPRSLSAGQTIAFSISGFPAGETVSVKIDDGDFCSAKGVHGACVVHQQRVASDGTAKGSFALPADLPAGAHWLRFLASEELVDDEGRYVGVKPYTLRGNTDFTVVTADGAQPSTPSDAGRTPSQQGSTSTPQGSTQAPAASAPGAVAPGTDPGAEAAASGPLTVPAPPGTASTSSEAPRRPDSSVPSDVVVQAGAETGEDGFPFVGLAVLLVAGVATGLLLRRRRKA